MKEQAPSENSEHSEPDWKKHLPPDTLEYVQKLESFSKKFFQGKVTQAEHFQMLKSLPPKLRQRAVEQGKLPADFFENLESVEKIIASIECPKTPEDSRKAAIYRILEKRLGIDLVDPRAEYVFALFNIGKHGGGMPLKRESLDTYDRHLFSRLKMTRESKSLPPLWSERREIAAQRKDLSFPSNLTRAYNKPVEIRPEKLLIDLQIGPLQFGLLCYWTEILGLKPRVGLCEFTHQAISDFLVLKFDPKRKLPNDPFDKEKIKDVLRRTLKLIPKERVVTAFKSKGGRVFIVLNGKEVAVTKG